jgi:hypothetical protein
MRRAWSYVWKLLVLFGFLLLVAATMEAGGQNAAGLVVIAGLLLVGASVIGAHLRNRRP